MERVRNFLGKKLVFIEFSKIGVAVLFSDDMRKRAKADVYRKAAVLVARALTRGVEENDCILDIGDVEFKHLNGGRVEVHLPVSQIKGKFRFLRYPRNNLMGRDERLFNYLPKLEKRITSEFLKYNLS